MRRRRQRAFVRSVCFLLAALLLVLALAVQIRLRAVESELSALRKEKAELESENGILSVRLAARTSLEEIERRAILSVRLAARTSLEEIERRAEEELGMRPCRGDQIAEIGIEEDDAA